jgi:hypothetical protein
MVESDSAWSVIGSGSLLHQACTTGILHLDFISYLVIGMLLGARTFYVLFYNLQYYIQNPIEAFMIWHGGLSFHGAAFGMTVASWFFAKKYKAGFFEVTDSLVICAGPGLFLGRIGNFINAESNLTFDKETNTLTVSHTQNLENGDILSSYVSKSMGEGSDFMNTCMINFVSDYTDTSSGCVGGLIDFRTRGNVDDSNLESSGYSRATIGNDGKITFYAVNGIDGYTFPQTKPTNGQILSANGTNGDLTWQSGVWQSYTPTITSSTTITSSVMYSKYTVIGKTCMGSVNCNISNVVVPEGASSSILFSLPLTGTNNGLAVGSGTLTIDSTESYPIQTVLLVTKISDYNDGGEGPAICELWYTANNGTTTDRQTCLENDYLPTSLGSTVTWNGYSGGVDISFNFSYEIE